MTCTSRLCDQMGCQGRPDCDLVEKPAVGHHPTGIEALVCQDIAERQKLGTRKYGVTLAENPLTHEQWLQHAYEESLDRLLYLKCAILKERSAQQALTELQARYDADLKLMNDRSTEQSLLHIHASKRNVEDNQKLRVENDALKLRLEELRKQPSTTVNAQPSATVNGSLPV